MHWPSINGALMVHGALHKPCVVHYITGSITQSGQICGVRYVRTRTPTIIHLHLIYYN